ncbi:MAG: hypothetical protein RQ922_05070 [Thermoproteota archaeon]|nr:hypothetical protein [Thermoproteota archaeon]
MQLHCKSSLIGFAILLHMESQNPWWFGEKDKKFEEWESSIL